MNKVLAVHEADLDAVVQAGVTRKQLNEYIKHTGLFFPVDPGADATLGGMAATRASGTNAVRYGTMRENVLSLKVVLADGRVIQTSRRAKKSAAGYDLTRLFVGSEGTLGIITEVTVRLYPVQEAMSAAVCAFDIGRRLHQHRDPDHPGRRADRALRHRLREDRRRDQQVQEDELPRRADACSSNSTASKASVVEQAEAVQAIAKEHGGMDFVWATKPEERTQLWQARHDAYFACLQLRPGSRAVSTDVCVPISRLAECVRETMEDVKSYIDAGAAARPHRRRQFPPHVPGRPGQARGDRAGEEVQPAPGRARARDGRHLHRRARHRPGQDGLDAHGAGRGRDRPDARHQAQSSTRTT